MIEISTSILNVEEENSLKVFYNLETAKTNYFHIDVMDGEFVEDNTTIKMSDYTSNIKKISNLPLDVHLMVRDTKKYIDEYIPFEPCYITIHIEVFDSLEELEKTINYIKEQGAKVGISIKPETNVEKILPVLNKVNLVLIMTVEPGKGGQKLIPQTIEKIKSIYEYREKNSLDFLIEADGGINLETINPVKDAGIDIAVVGSAIIKSDDYAKTIKSLKK